MFMKTERGGIFLNIYIDTALILELLSYSGITVCSNTAIDYARGSCSVVLSDHFILCALC